MKMIKIILSLMIFLSPIIAQDGLSGEDLINLANKIKELQRKDSLRVATINNLETQLLLAERQSYIDSNLIVQKDYYISIMENNEKLLRKEAKLYKPKWYESQTAYYIYGVVTVLTGIWGINQLMGNQFNITVDDNTN